MNSSLHEIQARYPIRTATLDGVAWSYRDTAPESTAIPLLMLPGAGGTGDVFYRVLDTLGAGRRIVTVNYPAVADTSRLAGSLRQLLDRIGVTGLQRLDLFGSSLGGFLAQLFAIKNAGRVRRCMFGNTFYDASWLREKIAPNDFARTPAEDSMGKAIRGWEVAPGATEGEADLKATMLALLGAHQTPEMGKAALLAVLRSQRLPAVPLAADAIALLDADDDPVVDEPTRTQMRERYAGSRQYRLAHGGHYPALLNRVAFLAALEEFFPRDA